MAPQGFHIICPRACHNIAKVVYLIDPLQSVTCSSSRTHVLATLMTLTSVFTVLARDLFHFGLGRPQKIRGPEGSGLPSGLRFASKDAFQLVSLAKFPKGHKWWILERSRCLARPQPFPAVPLAADYRDSSTSAKLLHSFRQRIDSSCNMQVNTTRLWPLPTRVCQAKPFPSSRDPSRNLVAAFTKQDPFRHPRGSDSERSRCLCEVEALSVFPEESLSTV